MSWEILTDSNGKNLDSEILPVHTAYLGATNEILYFGGDQHDPKLSANHQVDATRLFSVATKTVTKIPSPPGDADVFCCGHAFLGDDDQVPNEGRLLVAGGTDKFPTGAGLHHDHATGIRNSSIYHPGTRQWTNAALLNEGIRSTPHCIGSTGGRWYPQLITLADGSVLAMAGHPGPCDMHHDAFIPEVFTSTPGPSGAWHMLGNFNNQSFQQHNVTWYSRLHLLPTGDVFSSSPMGIGDTGAPPSPWVTCSLSIGRSPWSGSFNLITKWQNVELEDPFFIYGSYNATSVLLPLLPPKYEARVLIAGLEQPFILDLTKWHPGGGGIFNWAHTAPRKLANSPRRLYGHGVILPTGEVLFCGGIEGVPSGPTSLVPNDSPAVKQPEIFNPFMNDDWSAPNDPANVTRQYHSVALLLPDGSVWTAGSDHNAGQGVDKREPSMEIYKPWYYGNPDRPHIDGAPERVFPREAWPVKTAQAARIQHVAMVRCGTSTHAFNADQRYIGLHFEHKGSDLMVEFPPNNNIMVPGFYFLYVINDAGLPSFGTTVYARPDKR